MSAEAVEAEVAWTADTSGCVAHSVRHNATLSNV